MRVQMRFFGPARDLLGDDCAALTLPDDATVATLRETLSVLFPPLKMLLPRCRFAVNDEYADETTPLRDGDEVALIPPVSGGTVLTHDETCLTGLVDHPIDLNELLAFVPTPEAGAIVTFLGIVRRHSKGKEVTALTYDAYLPMAERELRRIAEEVRERWQVSKVAIVHRVGTLSVGEISVAIVVSAPHRGDAFAAARHIIERLKEIVPIWKREHFHDGSAEWVMP
jgi:molybdopterin converting factor subunit 1